MSENATNEAPKFVSPANILGIMLVVGTPDFFTSTDRKDALTLALGVYREWNPNWSGEGKFPVEVCLATSDVPVGGVGIADLTEFARASDFAMGLPPHSMYVQPVVLTRKSLVERGRPEVQACLVTYVRRSPGIDNRILLVQGSLDFRQ